MGSSLARLHIESAIRTNFGYSKSVTYVPAPKIKEICRLHNKMYTYYDFFDQRTTTIYCVTTPESEMKDMLYMARKLITIKISSQTA